MRREVDSNATENARVTEASALNHPTIWKSFNIHGFAKREGFASISTVEL
jgi:hypothetical protein